MTRSILGCPIEPKITNLNPHYDSETYLIQVITPIFGGGVEPGENDLGMVIRPSSIRGHLRFWWRATRGAKFDTAEQLFDREGEIWGTPDSPSPITIQITQPSIGELRQRKASDNYGFQNRYGPESYVLFPARVSKSPICKEGFSFQLKISWLKHEKLQHLRDLENAEPRQEKKQPKAKKIDEIGPDIKAAIWAWTNFGGIGSRTRRGCGALFCRETAPQDRESIGKWYEDHLNGLGKHKQRTWPTLPLKILIGSTEGKPVDEWPKAIAIMRSFRQGVGIGRNRGSSSTSKTPGRSLWPEPETIREISKSRMPKHQRLDNIPNDSFPRAEFGLPIVFHFKDSQDPPESELCPVERMRMASPIILRPIAFGDGRIGVPLIIRLSTEPLNQVELKVKGKAIGSAGPKGIHDPKLATYRGSPMAGRSPIGSALEAFIAFAMEKKQGFKEVGL
jgi:CRISPR-associated protein Cmr1